MVVFLEYVKMWLVSFLNLIGATFACIITPDWPLYGLLPLFAITVSVSLLFFAIKIVRKFVWGT